MRAIVPDVLEKGRVTSGHFGSSPMDGFNGAFFVFSPDAAGKELKIISGTGMGWEHISVSLRHRCPTWSEMCWVKDLFWQPEEVVMQLHPAKSDYVNCMPYCLHLWRPINGDKIPLPPSIMVGPK